MKRFRFHLHALWVLRGQQEELARHRYAESIRAVETAAARVREARAHLEMAARDWEARLVQGAPAATVLQDRQWCQQLQDILQMRTRHWEEAGRISQQAWQDFFVARRHREMLERYRQRQRQMWLLTMQRTEQKELDDLAQQRHRRAGVLTIPKAFP